jgi:hypothetical protein
LKVVAPLLHELKKALAKAKTFLFVAEAGLPAVAILAQRN